MALSDEQLREFGERGYLVVPNVVGESWLSAADAEIDRLVAANPPPPDTVGKHFFFLPPGELPAAHAALTESGALAVAEELTAPEPPRADPPSHPGRARTSRPTVTAPAARTSTGTCGSALTRSRLIRSPCSPASSSVTRPKPTAGRSGCGRDRTSCTKRCSATAARTCSWRPAATSRCSVTRRRSPADAGRRSSRRPAARSLPARPQHRAEPHDDDAADALLPPRLPDASKPLVDDVPRRAQGVRTGAAGNDGVMSGTVEPVPARLHTITTRLVFAHQAAEAIEFYGKAFGAEPIAESFVDPDGNVVHAEIRIGDSVVFVTDEGEENGSAPSSVGGKVTAVMALNVPDVDEVWNRAIAAGCEVIYAARQPLLRRPRWTSPRPLRAPVDDQHAHRRRRCRRDATADAAVHGRARLRAVGAIASR